MIYRCKPGRLDCVSSDASVFVPRFSSGCEIHLSGAEMAGAPAVTLSVIYTDPEAGRFTTHMPLRVWFPARVRTVSGWTGVGRAREASGGGKP